MAIGFSYTTAYQCNAMCPMLIPVSDAGKAAGFDYSQCLCETDSGLLLNATGYPDNRTGTTIPISLEQQQARYQRVQAITGSGTGYKGNCFICSSSSSITVYEPCPTFEICTVPNMLGFRPATINSSMVCNTQNPLSTFQASKLQAPAVYNREMVNLLILVMSILFALQTLIAMIIAYAYFRFKDKYDSDWGKLTPMEVNLGIGAKLLPNLARLANLVSLIFLAMGSKFFFSDGVCQYDLNNQGNYVFYPTLYSYLIAMIFVWLFFCLLGGIFHNTYPRDTSFYNPRFPEEPNQNICVRLTCRLWCVMTNFGP
jgi:hypothetical protein